MPSDHHMRHTLTFQSVSCLLVPHVLWPTYEAVAVREKKYERTYEMQPQQPYSGSLLLFVVPIKGKGAL